MTLMLRPATPADIPAIAAIYRMEVLETVASFELDPPPEEEMLARMQAITGQGYPYLVAISDGAVAGYAYASAFRPRRAYRFTVENSVYVSRAHRRMGVARRLLEELIAVTTALGFRQMMAVISDIEGGSVALHSALGFVETGRHEAVGYKFGAWYPTVIMQRALGEGAATPPAELRCGGA